MAEWMNDGAPASHVEFSLGMSRLNGSKIAGQESNPALGFG